MNNKNTFVFSGLIIKEPKGYSGLCLDVDVASDGESQEEAKKYLIEAVNLYLEAAIENNLPVIRPVPKEDNPVFTRDTDVVESFKIKRDVMLKGFVF